MLSRQARYTNPITINATFYVNKYAKHFDVSILRNLLIRISQYHFIYILNTLQMLSYLGLQTKKLFHQQS